MIIDALYRNYTQKSKVFLYPLLEIRRGVSVTPIQTYMSWENTYTFSDKKLIVHYPLRNDRDFKLFEKVKLLGNPRFHAFHELEDNTGLYVFDMTDVEEDFWNVIRGKYSKLSIPSKNKILNFYEGHASPYTYVKSYLYPEGYHKIYAKILDVELALIREVNELCSLPDLQQETFNINAMVTKNKTLNLQT